MAAPNDDDRNAPQGAAEPAWLSRQDRPARRPPHLIAAVDEVPSPSIMAAAVAQQVATQMVYCIIALLAAKAFGMSAGEAVAFLCLSLVVLGLGGLLQAARRGPVGSGYGLSMISGISMLAPYALAAEAGASAAQAGLLALAAGLVAAVVLLVDRRILASIPSEVAGVVTFSIGAAVSARALGTLGFEPGMQDTVPLLAIWIVTFIGTGLLALLPGMPGRFALPLGALAGTVVALACGFGEGAVEDRIAAAPWLALPVPALPTTTLPDLALLPAFLIGVLATLLASQGSLLAIQRAGDAGWRRPDVGPIRRGLLGVALTVAGAGTIGGMAPVLSSANVALSVQARVLSRAAAVLGSVLLLLLACSPKAVATLVGLPAPVKAAMLLYLGCLMMSSGCQAIAARALDPRRTLVVGAGLSAALLVMAAPPAILAALPVFLRSPMMAGAVMALALHALTAPLVARRAALDVAMGPAASQDVLDRVARIAGAWGLRKDVAARLETALTELAEAFDARGVARLRARLTLAEDGVQIRVPVDGEPLALAGGGPAPSAEDLLADDAAQERFILWMAMRQAEQVEQKTLAPGRHELGFRIASLS